ncbi:MAG: prolipoprotein diacylglyceryl transferase [Candidatus Cloacimonetes bacterium]|jgi:phosphatidylglycerol---prolipoprotein diacylglyceryl transferase|nr:prolipoprotein diacylglyceryl transferase [Candidatus Cloacimonadota bacterium]MBT6993604.1 prolipoprotein diacylglyceryl transferase [Candidatus Cloacimonadota bacterium]
MNYPNISPTILKLGSLEIRWYGVLYIIAFIICFIFLKKLFKYRETNLSKERYDNLLSNIMLGVIIGGRLGYVVFYNFGYYFHHPLEIILPFSFTNGFTFTGFQGMSFHGGALGVIIAGLIFCKKNKLNFYQLADATAPLVAIGLGLGRIGNFINCELWGRITTKPWGMIFPNGGDFPRHPSQLYEALLEGLLLFFILFFILKNTRKNGVVFWSFIGFYGIFRFLIEFVREPDEHLGFFLKTFTMGQILSSFMIVSAIMALNLLFKNEK